MSFLAACVQVRSTGDLARNRAVVEDGIRRAASYGAKLIATPEATPFLGPHDVKVTLAEPLDGPLHQSYAELAAELGVHLLLGSTAESIPGDSQRCYNTSVLWGPAGELIASYRKMHLFDVDIPGGVRFSESATCAPGDQLVVAETALGKIGLSICYDLRFPELYRALRDQGAQILMVPSAFTLETGRAHWHPLLRARAIETQCFVMAPGQWGAHGDKGLRRSYGHSLIIDPWGVVIGDAPDGETLCLAEVDLKRLDRIREAMPLEQHRRVRS